MFYPPLAEMLLVYLQNGATTETKNRLVHK